MTMMLMMMMLDCWFRCVFLHEHDANHSIVVSRCDRHQRTYPRRPTKSSSALAQGGTTYILRINISIFM